MNNITQNSCNKDKKITSQINGILRCSRYAFGPNKLHLCGPDAAGEVLAYIQNGAGDMGLEILLKKFQTMYPYLRHIADDNNIKDAFDERVVEAYWIGNDLLENVSKKNLYTHLIEKQNIKKLLGSKKTDYFARKINIGAVPHHSFHVFDVSRIKNEYTGGYTFEHTTENIDNCRISWGSVLNVDGPFLNIKTQPLLYEKGGFFLGTPIIKKIARTLGGGYDIDQVKIGDIISFHWDNPCEIISKRQAGMLEKYTLRHIELANSTL